MPAVSHRTRVRATPEHLWSLLLNKIERPDQYIPGVSDVVVEQRADEFTINRSMRLNGGAPIRELITADPKTLTVVFKGIGDPATIVLVTNTVYVGDGEVYLEYVMSGAGGDFDATEAERVIRGAVNHMKELAERADF